MNEIRETNDKQIVTIKNVELPDNNKTILVTTNNDKLTFFKPNNVNKMYCVLRPEDLQLKLPSPVKIPKPGRPKKVHKELEDELLENNIEEVPRKFFRTRSGRITKPPRYIEQDVTESNDNKLESQITNNDAQKEITQEKTISINPLTSKRNISSQYRCETCKKAYLGRVKMMKHLQLNPNHVAPITMKKSTNKSDLWTDLITKSNRVAKEQQIRLICDEFTTFLQKARNIIPKLLKPETDSKNSCFIVDQNFSNALGIPEGHYSFINHNDANKIINFDEKPNDLIHCQNNGVEQNNKQFDGVIATQELDNSVQLQNNDQNSLLNLLDTGQVTFDSSNSEEVMNVDQLIHERLKSLTGGEIETNTNTQNLNLDLSLDMFTYHTN